MSAKTPRQTPTTKPLPPDAGESERNLAGALLLEPARVLRLLREAGFTDATFTADPARRVFGAVGRLLDEGRLAERLEVQREAGLDAPTVQALIDDCPTVAHAEYHLGIVRAAALKRAVIAELKQADGAEALAMALEKIRATLPRATGGATVNAYAWLLEPDEQERPIMRNLFDHGDRVAIVGQSKARKSFYALQLAVALATGTPFLGVETVKQTVLVVNGEIRAGAYKRRLRRMIDRLGIGAGDLSGLVVVNAAETGEPDTFADVLALAKRHRADVCVVDPAYLLLGDEVNQVEVKDSVRAMKRFAVEGVTLVAVYHATKGRMGDKQAVDRISGSGIFARDASTMISLCEHASEPDHVVVTSITRNYAPCEPITVRFEEGAFTLAGDVAPTEKTSATRPKVTYSAESLRECFDEEPQSYGDMVERIRTRLGCGRDRAKEEIKRAVRDGWAVTEPRGRQTVYTIRPNVD